jgi:hypothetical protein
MSSWRQALVEYSKVKGQYIIPKKGTTEYDEVKAIQVKLSANKENTPPVKEPKEPKTPKKSKQPKEEAPAPIKTKTKKSSKKNLEFIPDEEETSEKIMENILAKTTNQPIVCKA